MGHLILVLVIAVAVWIVTNVLRPREEQPTRPRPRSRPADLDRFLQEIERRRREAEVPLDVVPAGPRQVPEPPRPAPPVPPPVVEVVRAVVPPAVQPVAVTPAPMLRTEVAAPPPPATVRPRRRSRSTAGLLALLRSPDSLRTAILLREVLGPPACRRRPLSRYS